MEQSTHQLKGESMNIQKLRKKLWSLGLRVSSNSTERFVSLLNEATSPSAVDNQRQAHGASSSYLTDVNDSSASHQNDRKSRSRKDASAPSMWDSVEVLERTLLRLEGQVWEYAEMYGIKRDICGMIDEQEAEDTYELENQEDERSQQHQLQHNKQSYILQDQHCRAFENCRPSEQEEVAIEEAPHSKHETPHASAKKKRGSNRFQVRKPCDPVARYRYGVCLSLCVHMYG